MKDLAKVFDLCILAAAFFFTVIVLGPQTDRMTLAGYMAMRVHVGNCLLFALLLCTWHILFIFHGVYDSKRLTSRRGEALKVCSAALLASAFLLLLAMVFHIQAVTPAFILVFWALCTFIMVFGRLVARSFLGILRLRQQSRRFILIVGTNQRAINFANELTERPELGYDVTGFVDDDWAGIPEFERSGYTRSCNFAGLADLLRNNIIDEAAIYLPLRSYYEHSAHIVKLCEQHGIATRFDSQLFDFTNSRSHTQDWYTHSQVLVAGLARIGPGVVKRVLDCVVSALLLILLGPLLAIVAILVKSTSPGLVFFRQSRMGVNKRQFRIFKFRTMIAQAEQLQDELLSMNEMTGPVFKIKHDPRVTAIGRMLRKTSIDELPQLLNVLNGDMSLVGPRAMSLRDYRLFDQDWQRRRFSVKPGITCLWQVSGRNSLPFDKWMDLDMQYIDTWSLWLDLKILARTVPAVLRGTGAA
jgi:exopolysaccharide biosynthesis polyprenyl glycosylphosphotransferase